jgi:hypothetical protein
VAELKAKAPAPATKVALKKITVKPKAKVVIPAKKAIAAAVKKPVAI